MEQAEISIYLLNKSALSQFLLANRLRLMNRSSIRSRYNISQLPPSPDHPIIISVFWDQLSQDERHQILNYIIAHQCTYLVIAASGFSCEDAKALLRCGRCILIDRDADDRELERTIWCAADQLLEWTAQMAEYEEASSCIDRLSSREKEILNALAIGMSNKAAARLLDLSPRTVEVHRSNMIRKSGQKSLSDLLQVYYVIKRLQPLTEIRRPLNRSAADHNHAPTNSANIYLRQSPKTLPKDADEMAGREY